MVCALDQMRDYRLLQQLVTLLVKTFKNKQFSSPVNVPSIMSCCGQTLPSSVASYVPFHGSGGCGACTERTFRLRALSFIHYTYIKSTYDLTNLFDIEFEIK
jgi:hypothetical protein